MKTLLIAINAKYIHSCLAIHSLKAYAEAGLNTDTSDIIIETAEYTINQPLDDILSDICDRVSDQDCLIAFSCYIWNIEYVKKLSLLVKHAIPNADIWVGGPEVSYCAESFLLENQSVTGVMTGEGEAVFSSLIQAYLHTACSSAVKIAQNTLTANPDVSNNMPYKHVPGIVFRTPGNQAITNPPAPLLDLDFLVFPYPDQSILDHHILYYESSRGCPFGCIYCLSSIDRRVRFKSLSKVFDELSIFLGQRVPLVKFVDRTFNCDHKRTLAIWQFLKEHDNGVTRFHFEVTANLLNEEELALLATLRPGLVQLEIGVQSANPETLSAIDRTQDIDHLRRVTAQIHQNGNIHQHLDLIAGLPYEDLESFSRSFDIVYDMQPDQLQLGFLKVLQGSKMHRLKGDYELVYRPWPPYEVISTRWISASELLLLKNIEEMVEIYYNSGQFQMTLTYLMHFFSRPWDFFLCFAEWMKENGHIGISHNRLQKYNLLRAFALKASTGVNPDALDSILLYDLYLREKIKTRPEWAPDQNKEKERISSLYHNEEIRTKYFSAFSDEPVRQIRHETHIEIFSIDVAKTAGSGIPISEEQVLLFSYRKKDPLNGSASVKTLSYR
ncbi:MAG: B12-binding domain-containing radical SAM protein [Eubacterium sp.]|nr:B12-binding domain-containing radical SAM protein [Eubacterium sp.]